MRALSSVIVWYYVMLRLHKQSLLHSVLHVRMLVYYTRYYDPCSTKKKKKTHRGIRTRIEFALSRLRRDNEPPGLGSLVKTREDYITFANEWENRDRFLQYYTNVKIIMTCTQYIITYINTHTCHNIQYRRVYDCTRVLMAFSFLRVYSSVSRVILPKTIFFFFRATSPTVDCCTIIIMCYTRISIRRDYIVKLFIFFFLSYHRLKFEKRFECPTSRTTIILLHPIQNDHVPERDDWD